MKKNLIAALLLILFITGCQAQQPEPYVESTFALDTVITVTLYEEDPETIEAVFKLIKESEARLSRHLKDSEIDQINANAGAPVQVSPETSGLINRALDFSVLSRGLFDITVGPLTSLWDIGSEHENQSPPAPEDIQEAVSKIDYSALSVEGTAVQIGSGQSIDLGGIAKGYIADQIVELLKERGVEQAILNLGGNVYIHGGKTDGSPFAVGIQNPDRGRGDYMGILRLRDASIVTSGLYERFFIHEDTLYHHILNPQTGYPVDNALKSVTIVSASSLDGDALSTTLFLMGLMEGYDLAESLEDIDAIFITKANEVIVTSGISDNFELTDTSYKLKKLLP